MSIAQFPGCHKYSKVKGRGGERGGEGGAGAEVALGADCIVFAGAATTTATPSI